MSFRPNSQGLFPQPFAPVAWLARPLVGAPVFVAVIAVFVTMQVWGQPFAPVVVAAGMVGLYMALNIGANDVANNVGPAVGAGAISMVGALVIAMVFEAAGALIAGGDVVGTISKGIIAPQAVGHSGDFVRLMIAALVAAAIWINVATAVGAPVSTTHSIVGGVLGGGLAAAGLASVNWTVMGMIAASWVLSPALGAAFAAAVLALLKALIAFRDDRVSAARQWVPVFVGAMAGTFAAYLAIKGLHRIWRPDAGSTVALSAVTAIAVYAAVRYRLRNIAERVANTREEVGRLFTIPLVVAAALLSFAHGSNDVANAVGPLAAIVHIVSAEDIAAQVVIPRWVMVVGALGLSVGLALFGGKMVRRVGSEITEMDRLRAFAVVLSAAVTVIVASALALPVSSTHIALGAVFGVGFLREYLENQAGKVRAIRALYDDYREPKLFDTPRSEIRSLRAAVEDLNRGLPDETIRRQLAHLTEKAERAVEEWQAVKLVRRSHLRTIVAAWLVTVPATAGFAAVVYFVLSAVPLPGIAD